MDFDKMMEDMIDKHCKELKDQETKEGSDEEVKSANDDVRIKAVDLLNKFRSYMGSIKFDMECGKKAKKYGMRKDIVKNAMARKILGTTADCLHVTIEIVGDAFIFAAKFFSYIITNIARFCITSLHKLVTVFTLNCGTSLA